MIFPTLFVFLRYFSLISNSFFSECTRYVRRSGDDVLSHITILDIRGLDSAALISLYRFLCWEAVRLLRQAEKCAEIMKLSDNGPVSVPFGYDEPLTETNSLVLGRKSFQRYLVLTRLISDVRFDITQRNMGPSLITVSLPQDQGDSCFIPRWNLLHFIGVMKPRVHGIVSSLNRQ